MMTKMVMIVMMIKGVMETVLLVMVVVMFICLSQSVSSLAMYRIKTNER